jgi:hypothetical protein
MKRDKRESRVFLPTSHDIRQACERIQEGWTPRERQKRAGWAEQQHWLPPLVEADSLYLDGLASHTGDTQPY